MRRVVVIGNSGSGKTRFARALAERSRLPYLELDGVYHQPNWTPIPTEQFRERVAEFVSGDSWVIDGNYAAVQDIIWPRADTVVWLDLARWLVNGQVVRRTVTRGLRHMELWNGNREDLRNVLRRDRDVNIMLWSLARRDEPRGVPRALRCGHCRTSQRASGLHQVAHPQAVRRVARPGRPHGSVRSSAQRRAMGVAARSREACPATIPVA